MREREKNKKQIFSSINLKNIVSIENMAFLCVWHRKICSLSLRIYSWLDAIKKKNCYVASTAES